MKLLKLYHYNTYYPYISYIYRKLNNIKFNDFNISRYSDINDRF